MSIDLFQKLQSFITNLTHKETSSNIDSFLETSKKFETIYFVIVSDTLGSSILRAYQIADQLSQKLGENKIKVINQAKLDKRIKNSLFIWIKHINPKLIKKLKHNMHIYDVIDNFIYQYDDVVKSLNENIVDGVIVNNNYMVDDIKRISTFIGRIHVIHHHWDPRVVNTKKEDQDQLKFGFLGSVGSLKHTDNFLHHQELCGKYNIEFVDTDIGKNVSQYVREQQDFEIKKNLNAMEDIILNFNCHMSIREIGTTVFNYKTTAKVAMTAAFGHNIITTYEKAVADVLPITYPFILEDTKIETVEKMINVVIEDYNNGKHLWNKGLEMMREVKEKLSLEIIASQYDELINNYES